MPGPLKLTKVGKYMYAGVAAEFGLDQFAAESSDDRKKATQEAINGYFEAGFTDGAARHVQEDFNKTPFGKKRQIVRTRAINNAKIGVYKNSILGKTNTALMCTYGAYEVYSAYDESVKNGDSKEETVRKTAVQAVKSGTSIYLGVQGAKYGALYGSYFGGFVGAAAGAVIGGAVGYFAGEIIVDAIAESAK